MSKTAADHEVLLICSIPHLVFEVGRAACGSSCNYVKRNALKKKKAKSSGILVYCMERLTWLCGQSIWLRKLIRS